MSAVLNRPSQRTRAVRRAAADPQSQQAAQNANAYGILYDQLVEGGLGLSPSNFQLCVAPTPWNWATQNAGFIGADQYDFCSTMPQWSAVGCYVSSGVSFDTAYGQFLRTLSANSSDPSKQQAITNAQNQLTTDSNQLQQVSAQAQATYNATVTNNNPSFTNWLASPAGAGFQAQMATLMTKVQADQATYAALLAELTNPNLQPALTAFADTSDYYAGLVTSGSLKFPPVPNWIVAQTYLQYVQSPGSAFTVNYSNNAASYDFSKTWAQGATVFDDFFLVFAEGSWSRVNEFYTDSSLQVSIDCEALSVVQIQPSKWYSGTRALAAGPYLQGYGENKASGEPTYMFGEGGVLPLMNTGMLVCLNPSVTVSCSTQTAQSFQQQWQAAAGIAIGPFEIGGSAGGQQIQWTQTGSTSSFTLNDNSNIPKILGVTVAVQPM